MNTTVNFEIAKLLKEKGFDEPTTDCYNLNGLLFSNGWCYYIVEDFDFCGIIYPEMLREKDCLAPTIAEVVMWLYEKHRIWISVIFKRHSENKHFAYNIREMNGIETYLWEHNTPTEAYEVAIKYTLENLI